MQRTSGKILLLLGLTALNFKSGTMYAAQAKSLNYMAQISQTTDDVNEEDFDLKEQVTEIADQFVSMFTDDEDQPEILA